MSRVTHILVYSVPFGIALAGPALFWDQGCFEREALTFVRQYTADRPLLNRVFDPHANDLGTYQARELSYLLDLANANAYPLLASALGDGFAISLVALATPLLLVIIFLTGVRRTTPHVDQLNAVLLLVCFLTSFGLVSTMGVFYRAGKPMLAAVILLWLFFVRRAEQKRNRRNASSDRLITRDAAVAFALAIVGGLLDRQGFYYVLTACVLLTVHYRLTGHLRDLLMASVTAAILLQLYNMALAPLVISTLNGYWPDFSYQLVPLEEMGRLPNHALRALALLLQNTGLLLGGFQFVAISFVVLVGVLIWHRTPWPEDLRRLSDLPRHLRHNPQSRVVAYGVLLFLLQVIMFALMIARHGYVYRWVDHRYWYYTFPFLVTALFALLLCLDAAMARVPGRYRRLIPAALLILATSNVLSLDYYRSLMTGGEWFGPVYVQCEALKASLRRGVAGAELDPEYRAFFDYHFYLQRRASRP